MTKHLAYMAAFGLLAVLTGGKISFLLWVGVFFSFLGGLVDLYAVEKKSEAESEEGKSKSIALEKPPIGTELGEAAPLFVRTPIDDTADGTGADAVKVFGSVATGARDAGTPVELEIKISE